MRALYLKDCLGLNAIDRKCYLDPGQPGYGYKQSELPADVFNSSVGDIKNFNGQAVKITSTDGGERQLQFLGDYNTYTQQQAATTAYQAGIGSAVSTLQTQGTNLDTQYGSLLQDVLGQGTVAMNTVTTGENNLLASRGITNDSPLYSAQMGSAQLPVQVANQSAVGTLGYTQAQLKNELATNIAGIQAGGAGTLATLPLEYGSLALASAANVAQIALANAQAKATTQTGQFISTPFGEYDTQTQQFVSGNGTSSTKGMVYQNGQWYLNV